MARFSLFEHASRSLKNMRAEVHLTPRFERPVRRWINFGFGHGRLIDAWTILHVATGVLLGFGLLALHLSLPTGLQVAIVIFVLYEWIESLAKIGEDVENAIFDIIAGLAGVSIAYGIAYYFLLQEFQSFAFGAAFSASVCLVLLLLGWNMYLVRRMNGNQHRHYWSRYTRQGQEAIVRDWRLFMVVSLVLFVIPYFL
ncbi:MAG: hypothetical protein RLZZ283_478 [Candidatus Parcubacteria bacterium]|jgi:hypothetical protein